LQTVTDNSENFLDTYPSSVRYLHAEEHDWSSLLRGLPDGFQTKQGLVRFVGPHEEHRDTHQNYNSKKDEFLMPVPVFHGPRLMPNRFPLRAQRLARQAQDS